MVFPSFFQSEDEKDLICQVHWLREHLATPNQFFSRLLQVNENDFDRWQDHRGELPEDRLNALRALWATFLHILSLMNYDCERVRRLLDYKAEVAPPAARLAVPWSGTSMRTYLEKRGTEAIDNVNLWVTSLRFGDPYRSAAD